MPSAPDNPLCDWCDRPATHSCTWTSPVSGCTHTDRACSICAAQLPAMSTQVNGRLVTSSWRPLDRRPAAWTAHDYPVRPLTRSAALADLAL